jgi:tetratricopeptide (TPR) repeat protein
MSKTQTETEKLIREMQVASERGDIMRVLTSSDEVLRRDPNNVDAMFAAGSAFMTNGHEGVASVLLNAARCATKDPGKLGAIWNNLGYALQDYQPEEGYRAFIESLKHGGAPAYAYDNLCSICTKLGRYAEALDWSDKAAAGHDVSYNRSFALLALGRWDEAWKLYAKSAGANLRPRTERDYGLPRWDGKAKGKVIVHGEQGVGDEIMFLSMLPDGFDGVIETTERTADLFRRSFPKARVYGTLLNNFIEWPYAEKADWHIEMGGLGEVFARSPFRRNGFCFADDARAAAWNAWLAEKAPVARKRIGIAWTGGTWSTGRGQRSIPFALIEELIRAHPEITFVNLEYEDRRDELSDLPQVLNPHWATKKGADLDDLAALCSSLDLVITATNSTVDLCGALGVPCWALVDDKPQWRYSEAAGEHEMWFYESVRTFRQKAADNGRWGRVMDIVNKALKDEFAAREAA